MDPLTGNGAYNPVVGLEDTQIAGIGIPCTLPELVPDQKGVPVKSTGRRRQWPQPALPGSLDLVTVVSPDGRFIYLSPVCKQLTGYDASLLLGSFISQFTHPEDGPVFQREFNDAIATGSSFRHYIRFRKANGSFTVLELTGQPQMVSSFSSQGMTITFRPCMSDKGTSLDAILEQKALGGDHKSEHSGMGRRTRIEDAPIQPGPFSSMYQPIQPMVTSLLPPAVSRPTADAYTSAIPPHQLSSSMLVGPSIMYADPFQSSMNSFSDGQPIAPAGPVEAPKFDYSYAPRGQQFFHPGVDPDHTVTVAAAAAAASAAAAGMAVSDPYRTPERYTARRTSTPPGTTTSAALNMTPNPERVCRDCGVFESPEWRRGPRGPKTLCNACGLRWAKIQRKIASEK